MHENIYGNADIIERNSKHTSNQREQTPKQTQHSGSEPTGRRCYQLAIACLGILCFLLLTMVILLFAHNNKLQTNYNTCTAEKEQPQMNDSTCVEASRKKEAQICPEGWTRFGTQMYYISTEKKNWQQSRLDCNNRGADLIIINSQQEQHMIHQMDVWIGLMKTDHEGAWKWVDGTPLATSYWKEGEPNSDKEACVHNTAGKDPLQSWNDAGCYWENNWVCEKEA